MTAKSKSINIAAAKLEPILDRVVIKRDLAQEKTAGGVELPDNAKRLPHLGTVIAVGPGQFRIMASDTYAFNEDSYVPGGDEDDALTDSGTEDRYPMQCKVGDRVLLPPSVFEIKLDPDDPQSKVVICQESTLLAILR